MSDLNAKLIDLVVHWQVDDEDPNRWIKDLLLEALKLKNSRRYRPPEITVSSDNQQTPQVADQQDAIDSVSDDEPIDNIASLNAEVSERPGHFRMHTTVEVPQTPEINNKAENAFEWFKNYLLAWEASATSVGDDNSDGSESVYISDWSLLNLTHKASGTTINGNELRHILICLYDAIENDQIDVDPAKFDVNQVFRDFKGALIKNVASFRAICYQLLNLPIVLGMLSYYKAKNPDIDPFGNKDDAWLAGLMGVTLISLIRNIHTFVGCVSDLKEDQINETLREIDEEQSAFIKLLAQGLENNNYTKAYQVFRDTNIINVSSVRKLFLDVGIIFGALASGYSDLFVAETMFKDSIPGLSKLIGVCFIVTEFLDTGIGCQLIGDRQLDVAQRVKRDKKLLSPVLDQRSKVVEYLRFIPGMDRFIAGLSEILVPDAMRMLRFLPLQSMPNMLGLGDMMNLNVKRQYSFLASVLCARNPEVYLAAGKQVALKALGFDNNWMITPHFRYWVNDPLVSSALLTFALSSVDDQMSQSATWALFASSVVSQYVARGLIAYHDPQASVKIVAAGMDNYLANIFRDTVPQKFRAGLLAALMFCTLDFTEYFASSILFVAAMFTAMSMVALESRFIGMFLAAGTIEYGGDFLDQSMELAGKPVNSTHIKGVDTINDAFQSIVTQFFVVALVVIAGLFVGLGDKAALVESFTNYWSKISRSEGQLNDEPAHDAPLLQEPDVTNTQQTNLQPQNNNMTQNDQMLFRGGNKAEKPYQTNEDSKQERSGELTRNV